MAPDRDAEEHLLGVLPLVAGLFVLVEALAKSGVTRDLAMLLHDLVQDSATLAAWASEVALAVGCNRRHPQLPDDTLQPFAERGQQMHSGHIADGAAPQPLAVNRPMSGCARALHPSPEEPFQRAHIQRPEKLAPHRRRRHATAQNSKFRQGLPAH